MNMFSRFVKDESGATAIEYGLIAAIVAVGIIAALGNVKGALQTTFNEVGTQLNTASGSGAGGGS
jgi:pilus assembly protein Flp/PilA